jgi:hypothetical protein
LDDQFLKQAVLALPLTLANACPIRNPENGDWCENDRKIFQDLVDNRQAEVVIKQSYSWPIRFCCLSVKLDNEKFQDALDYLTSHNVATKKSTKTIISTFENLINEKNDTYKFFNVTSTKFDNDNVSKINNESRLNSGTVSTVSSEKSKLKTATNKELLSAIDESNLRKFEEEKTKFFEKLIQEKSNQLVVDNDDYLININQMKKNYIQLDNECKFDIEISFIKNLFEFYVIDANKVDEYIIFEDEIFPLTVNFSLGILVPTPKLLFNIYELCSNPLNS